MPNALFGSDSVHSCLMAGGAVCMMPQPAAALHQPSGMASATSVAFCPSSLLFSLEVSVERMTRMLMANSGWAWLMRSGLMSYAQVEEEQTAPSSSSARRDSLQQAKERVALYATPEGLYASQVCIE